TLVSPLHMSIQRILVVDDDALSREFLVEAVAALGYEPASARSASEALEQIAGARPDLVLTDLRMPGMSGVDLVRRVRAEAPNVPSVLITAHGTIELAVQAMKEGACDVLLKPCSPQALKAAIERAERVRIESGSAAIAENEGTSEARGMGTGSAI